MEFIFIICFGYLVYLNISYSIGISLEKEKNYKIKEKEKKFLIKTDMN